MSRNRETALEALIEDAGFAAAKRVPLAGDASTRRYTRLVLPDRRAILMDAPPNAESAPCPPDADEPTRLRMGWNAISRLAASRVEAFAAVAAHLSGLGLSAPNLYGLDVGAGYAIVEDLGDGLYAQAIPAGANEVSLYIAAAELLAHVHAAPIPSRLDGPGGSWPLLDYDGLALAANVDLFFEWLPQAIDIRLPDRARAQWENLRDSLTARALTYPRAFTIRDYHAENLLWLPAREGLRRVGLLDFQDAVRGWRAWDFAMLLQDARRDVTPAAAEAAISAYLNLTGAEPAPFQEELAVLGALNALRILGIFARLAARDGRARYLDFMPREWAHLSANLQHPALGEANAFLREIAGAYMKDAA